jgi:predicted ATPase/class 3 adenylate cyclase
MAVEQTRGVGDTSLPRGEARIDVLEKSADSAPALPTGILTFLMTDVEGSTRLWDSYPSKMLTALPRHDFIVREAIARYGGVLVRRGQEGDSHFGVFRIASDAIAAAAAIQVELEREPWLLPEPLRVHLGIHTGEAELRDGDYYGGTVNRCARLRALSHGGQILFSGATYDVVQDAPHTWPQESLARALGEVRLAGLARPERVFELVVPGQRSDLPLLATDRAVQHNLPGELTSFVGRDRELVAIGRMLMDIGVRLVTLIGPGGVGKTRLSQRVAMISLSAFEDGVYIVPLAAITDPELVPTTILQTLGSYDRTARPILDRLVDSVRDKRMLLVLDNFEQVLAASVHVVELLRACPRLKVIVTSRSVLRVSGEHAFDVAPLELPAQGSDASELRRADAVRLFLDRATSASSDFVVTDASVRHVAAICERVEGLPLAIELVAAQARNTSVAALNRHLSQRRLGLSANGPRDLPDRHQTLRAAIEWSYNLLSGREQQLFSRLAVFAGGCAPAHAAIVAQFDGDELDFQQRLGALVDSSLLRVHEDAEGEQRYVMLETIREYAGEQLELGTDAESVRGRHANAYAGLLEEVARQRGGPTEATWLRRLATDHENVRAAITWAIARGQIDLALRMADTSWWFLITYGFTHEGIRLLREVLRLSAGQQTPLRARVLVGAGRLLHQLGDEAAAAELLDEALIIARSTDDLALLDLVLGGLSFVVFFRGEFQRGVELAEENVAVAEKLGNKAQIAYARLRLAEHLVVSGDIEAGTRACELAVRLTSTLGDGSHPAALDTLGLALRLSGDATTAVEVLDRAVALHRAFGWKSNLAEALFRMADALLAQNELARAVRCCLEGMQVARGSGSRRRVATGLRVAAAVAARHGDFQRTYRLGTMVQHMYAEFGTNVIPVDQADLESVLSLAASGLGRVPANEAPPEVYSAETLDRLVCEELANLATLDVKE